MQRTTFFMTVALAALMALCTSGMAWASVAASISGTLQANNSSSYQSGSTTYTAYYDYIVSSNTFDITQGWKISGTVSGLPPQSDGYWLEVAVIPKASWDYLRTTWGPNWECATFNKGVFMDVENYGAEAWAMMQDYEQQSNPPMYWPIAASGGSYAFDFEYQLALAPGSTTSGAAELWINGTHTQYNSASTAFGQDYDPRNGGSYYTDGGPSPSPGDYTEAYLVAHVWSNDTNSSVVTVSAQATPELPPSALLGLSMLPLGLAYLRGRRRKEH